MVVDVIGGGWVVSHMLQHVKISEDNLRQSSSSTLFKTVGSRVLPLHAPG